MLLNELADSLCDHYFQTGGAGLPSPPTTFPKDLANGINAAKWIPFAAVPPSDRHAFPATTGSHIHFNHYPYVHGRTLGDHSYLKDDHGTPDTSGTTTDTNLLLRLASANVLTFGHCRETSSAGTPGRVELLRAQFNELN